VPNVYRLPSTGSVRANVGTSPSLAAKSPQRSFSGPGGGLPNSPVQPARSANATVRPSSLQSAVCRPEAAEKDLEQNPSKAGSGLKAPLLEAQTMSSEKRSLFSGPKWWKEALLFTVIVAFFVLVTLYSRGNIGGGSADTGIVKHVHAAATKSSEHLWVMVAVPVLCLLGKEWAAMFGHTEAPSNWLRTLSPREAENRRWQANTVASAVLRRDHSIHE